MGVKRLHVRLYPLKTYYWDILLKWCLTDKYLIQKEEVVILFACIKGDYPILVLRNNNNKTDQNTKFKKKTGNANV